MSSYQPVLDDNNQTLQQKPFLIFLQKYWLIYHFAFLLIVAALIKVVDLNYDVSIVSRGTLIFQVWIGLVFLHLAMLFYTVTRCSFLWTVIMASCTSGLLIGIIFLCLPYPPKQVIVEFKFRDLISFLPYFYHNLIITTASACILFLTKKYNRA